MPFIDALHRAFRDRELVVVGINDEDPRVASEYLEEKGYELRTLLDPEGRVGGAYGVVGIPRMVLIGRDGEVKFYGAGAAQLQQLLREEGVW
jgi:peroxiredoxin